MKIFFSEYVTKLNELESIAKAQKKGRWADEEEVNTHIRNIHWTHDNPRHLVDSLKQTPVKGNASQKLRYSHRRMDISSKVKKKLWYCSKLFFI